MVNLSETPLPAVGEFVSVAWGLASVPGHVIEVYNGPRARVVVEFDAGVVDDQATTVTVPLGAIEPSDASDTSWARGARYERDVAAALRRMGTVLTQIEMDVVEAGRVIDILAKAKDGRRVAIETKARPIDPETLAVAARQSVVAASALGATWLVVAPEFLGEMPIESDLHFAKWRDQSDDTRLRDAVLAALSGRPPLRRNPGAASSPSA